MNPSGNKNNYTSVEKRLVDDPQNKQLLLIKEKRTLAEQQKIKSVGMAYFPDNQQKMITNNETTVAAYFTIIRANETVYENSGIVYDSIISLICENHRGRFEVIINGHDFSSYKIKSAIERNADSPMFSAIVPDNQMNRLLYNFIKGRIETKHVEIPVKAGFYKSDNKYYFVYHNKELQYETEAVSDADFEKLPMPEENELSACFQQLKNWSEINSTLLMTIFLSIASFLHTPLNDAGHRFQKLTVVTGCDTKKIKFLTECFKVFTHEEETVSLNQTEDTIREIIYSDSKDEMLIFEDDVTYKNKLANNIQILADSFIKRKTWEGKSVECNGLLICSQAQTMELLQKYAEHLIWLDLGTLNITEELICKVTAVRKQIQSCLIDIAEESVQLMQMCLNANDYGLNDNPELCTLASSVHAVEFICDKVLELSLGFDKVSQTYIEQIRKYLEFSESFFDADTVIEKFKMVISSMIDKKQFFFADTESDLSRNTERFPVMYLQNDLMLFTVADFSVIEQKFPFGLMDAKQKTLGMNLRRILYESRYLEVNNGEKLLYKTSLSSDSGRQNFIALKRDFLSSEIREMIPNAVNQNFRVATDYVPPVTDDSTERVILGRTKENNSAVYWSIGNEMLANKHLFIQADSGSGKTTLLFLIAQRLYQLGKQVIILDFAEKESYSEAELNMTDKRLSNTKRHSLFIDGLDKKVIQRYQSAMGNDILNSNGNSLLAVVRTSPTEAVNILRKLFYYQRDNNGDGQHDVYVILDEINSLNFEQKFSDENDLTVADVIFRQGRSIGLNLISATQALAKKGSRNKALLFNQSATKIALRLNSSAATGVAKSISVNKYQQYKEELEKLSVGEAIVYSGLEAPDGMIVNDKWVRISISPSD